MTRYVPFRKYKSGQFRTVFLVIDKLDILVYTCVAGSKCQLESVVKRQTPIRLDDRLLKSLDRFIEAWNRSGAPSTNRTLVIRTAIEQYLKIWRPELTKLQRVMNKGRIRDGVLGFRRPSVGLKPERMLRKVASR